MSDRPILETTLTEPELRALARVAMRDYPGDRGEAAPSWIVSLSMLPVPNFHAIDRLTHDGLVVWNDGWRLTEVGWRALEHARPKDCR